MNDRAPQHRDRWLLQSDEALLADCSVDTYRASGPGGQKRNKTSSAVRLRHHPSEQLVIAEESRSQHENKARAVRRLRMAIALHCRQPLPADAGLIAALAAHRTRDGRLEVSNRHRDYPACIALALDTLEASRGRVSDAAQQLGTTTSQLGGLICADGKVLDQANRIRAAHGLKALTP